MTKVVDRHCRSNSPAASMANNYKFQLTLYTLLCSPFPYSYNIIISIERAPAAGTLLNLLENLKFSKKSVLS